jgi:hypothetical protein
MAGLCSTSGGRVLAFERAAGIAHDQFRSEQETAARRRTIARNLFEQGGAGGAGVSNAGTIASLSNRGTISGGNGGGGPTLVAGGAGGAGVSNAGTITSLSNSGTVAGGNGGSPTSGAGGAGRRGSMEWWGDRDSDQ